MSGEERHRIEPRILVREALHRQRGLTPAEASIRSSASIRPDRAAVAMSI
jgi:hypothetical protein